MKDLIIISNNENAIVLRIKTIRQFSLINKSISIWNTRDDGGIKFTYYPSEQFILTDLNKITKGIEIRMEKVR